MPRFGAAGQDILAFFFAESRMLVWIGLVEPEPGDEPDKAEHADEQESAVPAELDEEQRSEEHTSELQSLMRSSYAVFCLNTKTSTNPTPTSTTTSRETVEQQPTHINTNTYN